MSKLFDKITSLGNIQVLRKHVKRWGVTKDVKLIWDIVLDFPVFFCCLPWIELDFDMSTSEG